MIIEGVLGLVVIGGGALLLRWGARKAQNLAAATPVFEGATLRLWLEPDGLHGEVKKPDGHLTRNDWGNRQSVFTKVNDGTGVFHLPAFMAPFYVDFHEETQADQVYQAGTPDTTIGFQDHTGGFIARTHRGREGGFTSVTTFLGTAKVTFSKGLDCKQDIGVNHVITLKHGEALALLRWLRHRPTQFNPNACGPLWVTSK